MSTEEIDTEDNVFSEELEETESKEDQKEISDQENTEKENVDAESQNRLRKAFGLAPKKEKVERHRKKRPKPKRKAKSFIPRVTRVKRISTELDEEGNPIESFNEYTEIFATKPTLRKYKDVILYHALPKYPVNVTLIKGKPAKAMSVGGLKATISQMPLPDIKSGLAYLIKNNMITHPENFVRFEDVVEDGEGKQILLHEIYKEPPFVWDNLVQVSGRVVSKRVLERELDSEKKKQIETLKNSGKELSEEDLRKLNEKMVINELPYKPQKRDVASNQFGGPYYGVVKGDNNLMMLTNYGVPYDDPKVYVKHPSRPVMGYRDSHYERVVDLCGDEMNRFLLRTSFEGDKYPELAKYGWEREAVSEMKRAVCPAGKQDVIPFVEKLKKKEKVDSYNLIDPTTRRELSQLGFPDELIDKLYNRTREDFENSQESEETAEENKESEITRESQTEEGVDVDNEESKTEPIDEE